MKKLLIVSSFVIVALIAYGREKDHDCGHPCEKKDNNVCCTGVDKDGVGWVKTGIHRVVEE